MMDKSNLVGLAEAQGKFEPRNADQQPVMAAGGQSSQTPATLAIRKGEHDPLGDKVSRIHIDTEKFTIYSIECGQDEIRRPRYYLKGDYASAEGHRQRLNAVSGALNRINDLIVGMQPDTLTFPFYRRHYRSLVERAREHQAQAMQQAFEGNGADAQQLLGEFRDEVENCRDSRNKMRYILANAVSVIILLALWLHFRNASDPAGTLALLMNSTHAVGTTAGMAAVRLVDLLALGAIGAFFAVSIGINDLKIDNAITIPEMLYAGFVRILIGVIGAGVVFLLIFGGWILTAVGDDYRFWTVALFAFVAGFSELFVPNALKRAEATASDAGKAATVARPQAAAAPAAEGTPATPKP